MLSQEHNLTGFLGSYELSTSSISLMYEPSTQNLVKTPWYLMVTVRPLGAIFSIGQALVIVKGKHIKFLPFPTMFRSLRCITT